jgi:hypothetical protein
MRFICLVAIFCKLLRLKIALYLLAGVYTKEKENILQDLNEKLASPEDHAEEIADGSLYQKHSQVQKEIEALLEIWENQQNKLENS